MNRTLEPELMESDAQVQAYAAADFSQFMVRRAIPSTSGTGMPMC